MTYLVWESSAEGWPVSWLIWVRTKLRSAYYGLPVWHMVPITSWWGCRGKKANPYWPSPHKFAQTAIHQILQGKPPTQILSQTPTCPSGQAAYTRLLNSMHRHLKVKQAAHADFKPEANSNLTKLLSIQVNVLKDNLKVVGTAYWKCMLTEIQTKKSYVLFL